MWNSIQNLVAQAIAKNDINKIIELKELAIEKRELDCAANLRKLEKQLLESNPSLILKKV